MSRIEVGDGRSRFWVERDLDEQGTSRFVFLDPKTQRFLAPATFTTGGYADSDCPVRLEVTMLHGRPMCTSINQLEAGPPLTGTLLRDLPIERLIQRALHILVLPQAPEAGHERVWMTPFADDPETHAALDQALRAREPRKRPLSDEHLMQVAHVYRAALSAGQPPVKAVQQTFHVARSTAGRYVLQARRRGHLGPTSPRRAGEITAIATPSV